MATKNPERGRWLAELLAERGMVPYHLAKAAGVQASTIQDIVQGVNEGRPDTLRKIAAALGLPQYIVFYAAGLLTELPPDLGGHPVKASIAHMIMDADDKQLDRLLPLLELWERLWADEEGRGADAGKKRPKMGKLPLAK